MGQILQFRLRPQPVVNSDALDLLSAVDFALRDLADITQHIVLDSAREQAQACREMLQEAYDAACMAE